MDEIIMVDDGNGSGVKIPSVMINMREGEKLISWWEGGSENTRAITQLVCNFDIVSIALTFSLSLTIGQNMTSGLVHPTIEDQTLLRISNNTTRNQDQRST